LDSFLPRIIKIGGPKQFRVYGKAPEAELIFIPSRELQGMCLWGEQMSEIKQLTPTRFPFFSQSEPRRNCCTNDMFK
jgi:hypothetical protein